MTEFDERLQQAISRGKQRSKVIADKERAKRLSEEELKRLHSKYRLQVSDHIEHCIKRIPEHFPGFQIETIFGEKGWGAACFRDDVNASQKRRTNLYSRLEVTVRPLNKYNVLDLAAKGTIHNREVFERSFFEDIDQASPEQFFELVDTWILEFAELYAGTA